MELIGEPGNARVEVELELLIGFDAHELLSPWRLARSAKHRDPATAATLLEPDVDAAAALFDEFGGRIGDDDAHV
jgi:hypothetical protein